MRTRRALCVALLGLGLGLALGLGACAGPEAEPELLRVGPLDFYISEVEPDLELRCASGGCHGRPERPLSLYAPGAYRADPEATYRDEGLSAWELEQNARHVAAFAHGQRALESLVVQKPLAPSAGGIWHEGGAIFAEQEDPSCLALVEWLRMRPGESAIEDGGAP